MGLGIESKESLGRSSRFLCCALAHFILTTIQYLLLTSTLSEKLEWFSPKSREVVTEKVYRHVCNRQLRHLPCRRRPRGTVHRLSPKFAVRRDTFLHPRLPTSESRQEPYSQRSTGAVLRAQSKRRPRNAGASLRTPSRGFNCTRVLLSSCSSCVMRCGSGRPRPASLRGQSPSLSLSLQLCAVRRLRPRQKRLARNCVGRQVPHIVRPRPGQTRAGLRALPSGVNTARAWRWSTLVGPGTDPDPNPSLSPNPNQLHCVSSTGEALRHAEAAESVAVARRHAALPVAHHEAEVRVRVRIRVRVRVGVRVRVRVIGLGLDLGLGLGLGLARLVYKAARRDCECGGRTARPPSLCPRAPRASPESSAARYLRVWGILARCRPPQSAHLSPRLYSSGRAGGLTFT